MILFSYSSHCAKDFFRKSLAISGYCIQMNFVLGWALKQLGYDMLFYSIYIYSRGFDVYELWPVHVGIVVRLDDRMYYVDAGTTRFISQPIEIVLDKIQRTRFGTFRFVKHDESSGYHRLQRSKNMQNDDEFEFENQLRLKLDEPKEMADFEEMNEYVQTEKHPMLYYRCLYKFLWYFSWVALYPGTKISY